MKNFVRGGALLCAITILTACNASSVLRYGETKIPDSTDGYAPTEKEREFLKKAESGHGYYAIQTRYIRATQLEFAALNLELGNLGEPVSQRDICNVGTGPNVKDILDITSDDRAGFILSLERNISQDEQKSFNAFKKSGKTAHFVNLKDADSGSARDCLIDFSRYQLTDLKVWNRNKIESVSLGIAESRKDKSNVGNIMEGVADVANVIKIAANPGSLVFNASGQGSI
ncbi:unnamed protein product, partial [Laminaria digitata]